MGRGLAWSAGVVITLILIRDGTLGNLFKDAANLGSDAAKGLKPITSIA